MDCFCGGWRDAGGACIGGASAAVLEQDTPSGSAVVRTSCEVEYSVVIPADVEIPFGALDTTLGHVYADVMSLRPAWACMWLSPPRRITA